MKKVLTVLFLCLTLAACLDTSAALQQPATRTPTATNTTQATASATATEPAPMTCKVIADALHVRSGAGVSYSVIGYLKAGDIVTIEGTRGDWYDIGAGFIHSKYCKVQP